MQYDSKRVLLAGAAMALITLATSSTFGSPVAVRVPIVCTRGPSGQTFNVGVTMPASQATGTTFAIRIDAAPSGKISHTGLNYIFDMQTDYVVPAGTAYVEGSARILPGTGTPNVRATARVWHDAEGIHLALPARVENGSGYTPPSIEFRSRSGLQPAPLSPSSSPGTRSPRACSCSARCARRATRTRGPRQSAPRS